MYNFFSLRKTLIIIVPLLASIAVSWKFFLVVGAPFRLDYAEGFIYTNSLSLLHGVPMYHSVDSAPYLFGFYTPLFNYIGTLCFKIFGASIAVLRSLSFLFYLATGVAVGCIMKAKTKNFFAAVIAAFLFYSAFIVAQWSAVARPDMLGLFLLSLGIVLILMKPQKTFLQLMLIALVFSLAFFSKQHFVFAPLAFFIFLLFQDKKRAWSFAGLYAFFIAAGVFVLHIFTHGEFTRQIFVYTGLVPYGNWHTAFRITAITGISALPLVVAAARNIYKSPRSFFSIYVLCSLLTFPMLLRDGGIQNYLLEFVLALILAAVTAVPWDTVFTLQAKRFYSLGVLLVLFFALWSFAAFPWDIKTYVTERKDIFLTEVSVIQGTPSLVEDPLVAYAANTSVEIDPYTYGQIAEAGGTSTDVLFSDMKKGTYTYIDDYGAFGRIPEITGLMNDYFSPVLSVNLAKPVKPFDYSLYNRHTSTEIGIVYQYGGENRE